MNDGRDETEVATIDGRPTAAEGEARELDRKSVTGERYRVINRLGKG